MDEKKGPVKVGEMTEPMVRHYILRIVIHQDPGGNNDKGSRMFEPIDKMENSNILVLIDQSDLKNHQDNGSSLPLIC